LAAEHDPFQLFQLFKYSYFIYVNDLRNNRFSFRFSLIYRYILADSMIFSLTKFLADVSQNLFSIDSAIWVCERVEQSDLFNTYEW